MPHDLPDTRAILQARTGRSQQVSSSVGIMILISVVELFPESIAITGAGATLASVALGAALVWGAHFIIPHIHLVEEQGRMDPALIRSAYLVVFGLILHDVPEGFAMANAYVASPALGVLVALAIASNLPEESPCPCRQ
jgi:ZIP family zinc transporter